MVVRVMYIIQLSHSIDYAFFFFVQRDRFCRLFVRFLIPARVVSFVCVVHFCSEMQVQLIVDDFNVKHMWNVPLCMGN